MGLFNFGKKKKSSSQGPQSSEQQQTPAEHLSRQELYGKAWLMIVSESRKQDGLDIMEQLDAQGYAEATVVLAMFAEEPTEREQLVKKAADAGNTEGIWEYSGFLPHAFVPDIYDANDSKWVSTVRDAAAHGSVDAMNEMGNINNRWGRLIESMYWYAIANAHGHSDAKMSMAAIAQKWKNAGCPKTDKSLISPSNKCVLLYLELYAGEELSIDPNEIVGYVMIGIPIAAYFTGELFENLGNLEMASQMYKAIALRNDPHGLKCYADMLASGRGVKKDIPEAVRKYQKAAELGERDAMYKTAEYLMGTYKYMAAYWYGLSHTRGNQNALLRLVQLSQ